MAGINDHLVLVCGKSGSGKSACLRNLRDPESVMYLNCENGKRLPFRAKFGWNKTVTSPLQVKQAFEVAETKPECKVIIIDTVTFMLDMYVDMFIKTAVDGRAAWGDFAAWFRNLMQEHVAKSTKKVIFLAHVVDKYNESEMIMETAVPVAGSLKNQGIEAFFSMVIATKKMNIDDLVPNALLNITEQEKAKGFKHVFQTMVTAKTKQERLRGPMGMWEDSEAANETFIDNDIQMVLDRLDEYYA